MPAIPSWLPEPLWDQFAALPPDRPAYDPAHLRRALLSAEGYQVERAVAVLDQWMEDAAERAAG